MPDSISSYQIVVTPNGQGIFLLGGYKTGRYLQKIYEMTCATKANGLLRCGWNLTSMTLPDARASFLAFYLPEETVEIL